MSREDVVTINLRNIPKELHRNAKVAAAQRGITLREFVLEAIQKLIKEKSSKAA